MHGQEHLCMWCTMSRSFQLISRSNARGNGQIEYWPTLSNPVLMYCHVEWSKLTIYTIKGLVVHWFKPFEILISVLKWHNHIHPKHQTLSLTDHCALNWPNYHLTLLYPRCFQHPRSFPIPSRSSTSIHSIWLSMGQNRVVTRPFSSNIFGHLDGESETTQLCYQWLSGTLLGSQWITMNHVTKVISGFSTVIDDLFVLRWPHHLLA